MSVDKTLPKRSFVNKTTEVKQKIEESKLESKDQTKQRAPQIKTR